MPEPTPDLLSVVLGIIDRYGLPLVMLIVGGFLVWKGILRFGSDVDRLLAAKQEQLDFVEARRVEEREGRIKAEGRLESNAELLREATDGFRDANELMKQLMEAVKK